MSQPSATDTVEFLRSIWPDEGYYCIAVKTDRGMRQVFFSEVERAAEFAVGASARGFDAYHACAVFKDSGSRKAANVKGVRALWLDVDVGPNKPYTDEREALRAVLSFCAATGLPHPLVVHSGGGWHFYWTFVEAINAADWLPLAQAFKTLCAQHSLHADPARTADAASILRPAGTSNYKRGVGNAVALKLSNGPYPLSRIAECLSVTAPAQIPNLPGVDNSRFAVKHNEGPAYARLATTHCRQLAHMRDVGGQLPEPHWYALLGVLAHCEDGEECAHEFSSGDQRYVPADTARKLEHARHAAGPTTCERLSTFAPELCAGCPHFGRVGSPITLGRRAPQEAVAGELPDDVKQAGAQHSEHVIDGVRLPHVYSPFKWSPQGALQREIKSEVEGVPNELINVYKAPLFLETIRTNELTNQIALTFRHWLPQEKWCEVQIPWADRSQKAVINAMAAANINVPRARERDMLLYIEQAIDSFQNFRKTEMEYATYGWRGDYDAFLVGSELYKRGSAAHTIVGVSEELRIRGAYMRAFGTYDDWRAAAQPLFAHEQQGFMVVAGFASTLMRFVNEAASAIIAAVSPEPRLGKSMGLIAARSIWGDDKSIDIGINDTTNSRFKMLALLNGLPATWDDMRKKDDPEVIKQFIHSFSQGRDKNRLDKSGNLRANISGWASILLVTSNISISELVGYDGETAQQARVLEYRFNRMEGIQFSDGMAWERQLRANRGTAGRRWVQVLMMPGVIEYLLTAIPTTVKRLEQRLGTSSASFYASMLACIVVASELLNRYGMLEFSTKRILEFGIRAAENAVTYMNETLRTPSGVVTQLINDSWDNALIVHDAFKPKTATLVERQPKARLAMRYEIKTARAFISRDYARGWCRDNNAMFHDIEDKLKAEGVLVAHNRRINLGAGTPFASGQVACWEVDLEHQALGGLKLLKAKEDERVAS